MFAMHRHAGEVIILQGLLILIFFSHFLH